MIEIKLTKSQMWTIACSLGDAEESYRSELVRRRVLRADGKRSKVMKWLNERDEERLAELKRIKQILRKLNRHIEVLAG